MGTLSHLLDAEISSYEMTEWRGVIGGEEVVLFAKPLTNNDTTLVGKKFPGFPNTHQSEGMLELVIRKSVNENGQKCFDLNDRLKVSRFLAEKVGDIFGTLFAGQMDIEDDEKFEERKGN